MAASEHRRRPNLADVTAVSEIPAIVGRVRDGADGGLMESEEARVTQLRQLKRLLEENDERINAALAADLGKSPIESFATETSFVVGEVEHAIEHVGSVDAADPGARAADAAPRAARGWSASHSASCSSSPPGTTRST